MAQTLLGKEVTAALNERIKADVEKLKAAGVNPTLGIIRVGERGDDISYERGAMKRCDTLGVTVKQYLLPADVTQEQLIATIEEVNKDDSIHGVLMFRPLPKHLDEEAACQALDPEKDVTIEYKSEHAEVVAALAEDQTAVGLLPQPFVTTALMKNENLRVALDLNELWESSATDGSRLVTGVVIARNDYLKEHEADIDAFMDAYKDSVEFVNSDTEAAAQIIGNHDIIPAEVAAKAIPECSIVFMEGDEMQTILSGYLNTLNEQNPETIGGQLPDEDFYYKR